MNKSCRKYIGRFICCFILCQFTINSLLAQNLQIGSDSLIIEQLDKLLDSWYAKNAVYHEQSQKPHTSKPISSVDEDSITMFRLKELTDKTVFPMVYNNDIKRYINLYTKRKQSLSLLLGLAKYYFPMFEEVLDKYNCPIELKYLAIIESALNPNAVSRAGATGLWQFMYKTGKLYGLDVNTLVDYRRDPIKATDAAARYLKYLSDTFFGDWVLAMAAYNCGPGNVTKAIVRSGGKTDFWDLYDYLPKETRGYVPAFYGAWFAMRYYDKYGITAAEAKFSQTDTIHIHHKVHFQQIEALMGIPEEELKLLNPQYKMSIVPATEDMAMVLILPANHINKFLLMKDSIYNYNPDQYFKPARVSEDIFNVAMSDSSGTYRMEPRRHVVKSGETLSAIARKYSTTATTIANLNKISLNSTLRIGQSLIVGYKKIFVPKPKQDTADNQNDTLINQGSSVLKNTQTDTFQSILSPLDGSPQSKVVVGDSVTTKTSDVKPADMIVP